MGRHVMLLVVLLSVVVAGCGGSGGASDGTARPPLTGTGTPAELTDGTQRETGFEETTRTTGRLNTTVSATIQGDVELRTTRRANVTTASVAYARAGDGPPAVFATYSVPAVEPFARADLTKNPAGGLSVATLAGRAQQTYTVTDVTETGTGTTTMLGNETTVTRYEATATRDGETVSVVVTVATVQHEGDYVTALVLVPTSASAPEASLFGGVTHG